MIDAILRRFNLVLMVQEARDGRVIGHSLMRYDRMMRMFYPDMFDPKYITLPWWARKRS